MKKTISKKTSAELKAAVDKVLLDNDHNLVEIKLINSNGDLKNCRIINGKLVCK